jgi:hypothetical protein
MKLIENDVYFGGKSIYLGKSVRNEGGETNQSIITTRIRNIFI